MSAADSGSVRIRPITADDAAHAFALSSLLNWPHRLDDWQMLIGFGRGFAAVDEGLVGTALWWPYGSTHCSVGMVIVSKACQGRGIGRALMQKVLDDAGQRVVSLNSTPAGAKLYADLGFEVTGQIRQLQGEIARDPTRLSCNSEAPRELPDDVLALDEAATGMPRRALLEILFAEGLCRVLRTNGELQGFAFRRRFGRGFLIGPVVANSVDAAAFLIGEMASDVAGFVRIDLDDRWPMLHGQLKELGLSDVSVVTSMVHGPIYRPAHSPAQYAVASQALG